MSKKPYLFIRNRHLFSFMCYRCLFKHVQKDFPCLKGLNCSKEDYSNAAKIFDRTIDVDESEVKTYVYLFLKSNKHNIFQFLIMTGCKVSCKMPIYTYAREKSVSDSPLRTNETHMIISLYAAQPITTVHNEYLVYDLMSFLADAAGMAGILLGLSFVSTYDGLFALIEKAKKVFKTKHSTSLYNK